MKRGEDTLAGLAGERVVLIEPEKAYTSRRRIEDLFKSFGGVMRICDPYVDSNTVEPLTAIPKGSELRLLTCNVFDQSRLRREIEAFRKEYSSLEIRVCHDKLHDRYIVLRDKLWLLGHSLNALGKKETFIVELGSDIQAQMQGIFDRRWANSPAFR